MVVNRVQPYDISQHDQVWVGQVGQMSQRTLHLCAHGCVHPNDKRVTGLSTFDAIFDLTLKKEEVHLNGYKDVIEVRDRIGYFIRQVDHQKHWHSALGDLNLWNLNNKPRLNFANFGSE